MEIKSLLDRIIPVYGQYVVQLEEFNRHMEELYSRIASMLPVLEHEINEESSEAKAMLDFMIQGVRGTGVVEAIEEIERGLLKNSGVLEEYTEKYSVISDNVMNRLESISSIGSTISKMKRISSEIKLFSINSVIVSSRAGQMGRGFKSISHFIIELSEEIHKTAQELNQYTVQIVKNYNIIRDRFVYLFDEIYKKRLKKANELIIGNIKQSISSVKEIYRILNDLLKRINRPLQSIPLVMTELQKQDIARQSIEHTVEVFKQVMAEKEPEERKKLDQSDIYFTSYLLYIMDKVEGDLDRTHLMVNQTNDSVKKAFQRIYDDFLDIEQDQKQISDYFLAFSAQEDSQGFLKTIFEDLRFSFLEYQESLKEETRAKKDLLDAFSALEKNYESGMEYFKVFEKYYAKMNNINVLAQIEMNKKTFDGHNSQAIRNKFYSMLDYLKNFKEDIRENVEKNFAALLSELKNFSVQQEDQERFVTENIQFLDKNVLEIQSLYGIIEESLRSVVGAGRKIMGLISDSHEQLGVLDQMGEGIFDLKKRIDGAMVQFRREYDQFLSSRGLNSAGFIASNPFIQRIQRNKVNIEKHIQENGEVELF